MAVTAAARARPSRALPSKPHCGYFRTKDGVELYFEDSGGRSAGKNAELPLLFVYGLGCSIQHWKYPRAYFAAEAPHRRQIWMDFRGHGRSAPPRSGQRLTLDLIVQDLVELLEARSVKACVVLGQSMGGSVALSLAHTHPNLVRGMVLLGSPARDPAGNLPLQPLSGYLWRSLVALNQRAPALLRAAYALSEPCRDKPWFMLPLREVIRSQGFNAKLARTEDIEEYITKVFEVSPTHFYDLAGELSAFDVGGLSPPISCPALLLAGANDKVVPLPEIQYLARHLPRSKVTVIPHGSHCPHFDDPMTVNRTIAAFLAECRL